MNKLDVDLEVLLANETGKFLLILDSFLLNIPPLSNMPIPFDFLTSKNTIQIHPKISFYSIKYSQTNLLKIHKKFDEEVSKEELLNYISEYDVYDCSIFYNETERSHWTCQGIGFKQIYRSSDKDINNLQERSYMLGISYIFRPHLYINNKLTIPVKYSISSKQQALLVGVLDNEMMIPIYKQLENSNEILISLSILNYFESDSSVVWKKNELYKERELSLVLCCIKNNNF